MYCPECGTKIRCQKKRDKSYGFYINTYSSYKCKNCKRIWEKVYDTFEQDYYIQEERER